MNRKKRYESFFFGRAGNGKWYGLRKTGFPGKWERFSEVGCTTGGKIVTNCVAGYRLGWLAGRDTKLSSGVYGPSSRIRYDECHTGCFRNKPCAGIAGFFATVSHLPIAGQFGHGRGTSGNRDEKKSACQKWALFGNSGSPVFAKHPEFFPG